MLSIPLGGGSIVRQDNNQITIGPTSVGYQLTQKALIFGGDTLTTSDIAVAAGLTDMGDKSNINHLQSEFVHQAVHRIKSMLEDAIDQVKVIIIIIV